MRLIARWIFIFSFGITSVFAANNWSFGVGAELYMPKPSGTISNVASGDTTFEELGYTEDTATSLLYIDVSNHYKYLPNLKISYFHLKDTQNADLNKTIQVAGEDYNATVQSDVDYSTWSVLLYKGFVVKGDYFSLFSHKIYSGDLEFQLGVDSRFLQWKYTIKDRTNLTRSPSWIEAKTVVPLVYLGMNYYFYNLGLEAKTSNLAISRSKIIEYDIGAKYRFSGSFYLKAGYLYSNIQFVHNDDEVDYTTQGARVGFEYFF